MVAPPFAGEVGRELHKACALTRSAVFSSRQQREKLRRIRTLGRHSNHPIRGRVGYQSAPRGGHPTQSASRERQSEHRQRTTSPGSVSPVHLARSAGQMHVRGQQSRSRTRAVCHGIRVASSLDLSQRCLPLVQIAGVDPVLQGVHGAAGLVRAEDRAAPAARTHRLHPALAGFDDADVVIHAGEFCGEGCRVDSPASSLGDVVLSPSPTSRSVNPLRPASTSRRRMSCTGAMMTIGLACSRDLHEARRGFGIRSGAQTITPISGSRRQADPHLTGRSARRRAASIRSLDSRASAS